MSKTIISNLTDAISAVVDGNNDRATKLLLSAVKELSGVPSAPRANGKRGAKPMLNAEQTATLVQRVKDGESIVSVARSFGVSYQTAYRYLSKARTTTVAN